MVSLDRLLIGERHTIEGDGRALCQRLRNELGDQWRVGWVSFEHEQRHVQRETGEPVTPLLPGTGREALHGAQDVGDGPPGPEELGPA